MAVSSKDKRSISALLEESKQAVLNGLNDSGVLDNEAELAIINIRTRTKAGRDRHGDTFTPYAESTKRRKRRKNQRIRPPTLTDRDVMLNDMDVTGRSGYWGEELIVNEVGFRTRESEQIARFHIDGTSRMPQRDFFGMTPEDEAAANERIAIVARRSMPSDRRRRVRIQLFRA